MKSVMSEGIVVASKHLRGFEDRGDGFEWLVEDERHVASEVAKAAAKKLLKLIFLLDQAWFKLARSFK